MAGALAAAGVASILAALAARGGGAAAPTTTSTTGGAATSTSTAPGPVSVPSSTSTTGTTQNVPATGAGPAAPWRSDALSRSAVPAPFLEAWTRAKNRADCALLVPSDAGPQMEGARVKFDPVAGDAGWDIFLRRGAGILEILGLFDRSNQPEEERPAPFSRRWSDGSVARYGPDVGPESGDVDPEATAVEAVLTLPDQRCAYRIYDTLGKSHLEFVLEHLRFVEGTS